MNPALTEYLLSVARAAEAAPHGHKNAVYQQAAKELGMSLATLHRKLKEVFMPLKSRKRRSDANTSALAMDEARIISAYMMESARKNNKRLCTIEDALDELRANGVIRAECACKKTGELRPLSVSAVSRALYKYRLHPDQLNRPAPTHQLRSLHPNHCWQIDPSLCVVYYLPKDTGMRVMSEKEFYKNKPANIERIERERVWRYVITDHTSGWIYVHYVLGAESGKNLVESFIAATQKRHAEDPVHGIPQLIMVDPGSANTGAVFRNLCEALGIKLLVNEPGKPWAKGQVEKANDLVEKGFEHRIKLMKTAPTSIDTINELAWQWMRWFNSTKIHTRTKETRYATWSRITADQLVIAPSIQVMRELSFSAATSRVVSGQLTFEFKGKEYSVAEIPGVEVKSRVQVTINPWRENCAQVLIEEDGEKRIYVLEPMEKVEFGFPEQGAIIDQEYKRHKDTVIDKNRKDVERLLMDAETDEEAAQKRKGKFVPFGGRIDPMKNINDTVLPDYLPKRGTANEVVSPVIEIKPLTPIQLAKKLANQMGSTWNPQEHFPWIKQHYPDGAQEDQVAAIMQQLQNINATPLRLIK